MASSYPGAVDALVRPDGTDPLSDGHAALHNATSDAVEAVQTELGVNPAGSEATVAARLTAAESATTAAQSTATAAVPKATYDAHTVLAATTDNTPAAVTVGEQTIVGRKTGGNITALTAAETKTLLAIGQSDVTNLTSDLSAKAPLASPTFTGVPAAPTAAVDTNTTQVATTAFTVAQIADDAVLKSVADAAGDLVVGSAADTFGKLALGTDNYALTVNTAGSGVAKVGWEDPTANPLTTAAMALKVNTATVGNLLTENQASFETSVPASGTNCTITQDSTYAVNGTYSMLMTSTAAGAMSNSTSGYSVAISSPGVYTVYAKFRSDQASMGAFLLVTGSGITQDSARATATTGGWTTYYSTFTATTATTALLYVSTSAVGGHPSAGGQKLWIDTVGLWQGAGGEWAAPGRPIPGLGQYTDETVGRRTFVWDHANERFQMVYGDTGWRTSTGFYGADWDESTFKIRRINNTIYCGGYLKRVTASGAVVNSDLAAQPSGWQADSAVRHQALALRASSNYYPAVLAYGVSVAHAFTVTSTILNTLPAAWAANDRLCLPDAFATSDAWPTTLPGTASGSIPA